MAFEQFYGPLLVHERVDIGLAQVSYYLVSVLGKSKRGRKFKFEDFLPPWMKPEPKAMTPEQLGVILQGWADANNFDADGRRRSQHEVPQ